MYSRKRPGHRFRAEFFTSARELVKWDEEKEPPDLVLLDIYMPEKTGMAAVMPGQAQVLLQTDMDVLRSLYSGPDRHWDGLGSFGCGKLCRRFHDSAVCGICGFLFSHEQ